MKLSRIFSRSALSVLAKITLILAILSISACSGVTPQPTATESPLPPSPEPPTKTLLHTPTLTASPAPTATATPTAIPTLGILTDGFSAWCLPQNQALSTEKESGSYKKLEKAREGEFKEGVLNILAPNAYCTYVYTFNQPMPKNTKLVLYGDAPAPFYTIELSRGEDNPNIGFATPKHSLAYNPDFWEITVRFVVQDANGNELRADKVRIYKILPPRCWDGSLPNPVTLECPIEDT